MGKRLVALAVLNVPLMGGDGSYALTRIEVAGSAADHDPATLVGTPADQLASAKRVVGAGNGAGYPRATPPTAASPLPTSSSNRGAALASQNKNRWSTGRRSSMAMLPPSSPVAPAQGTLGLTDNESLPAPPPTCQAGCGASDSACFARWPPPQLSPAPPRWHSCLRRWRTTFARAIPIPEIDLRR